MNAVSSKGDMIDLMIEHEQAAAELYMRYARLFRTRDNPWEEMMQEERAHADVLRTLSGSLHRLTLVRNTTGWPHSTIQANVDFVKREIALAQSGPMSMLRALSVCLSIEQTALEHEFYTIFQPVSEQMKQEFSALAIHMSDHVQRIEDWMVQEHANQAEQAPVAKLTRLGRIFTMLPI